VLVVSVDTGRLLGRLAGASGAIAGIAVDPDGNWLLAGSRDGGVRAFALAESSARVLHGPTVAGERCAAAPDASCVACLAGRKLHVAPTDGGAARDLDVPESAVGAGGALELAVGSRGRAVAFVGAVGSLARLDDAVPSLHDGPATRAVLAFDHRGDNLAVAGADASGRTILRLVGKQGRPGAPLPAQSHAVTALAFTADDTRLAVALEGGEVSIYDTANGTVVDKRRPLEQSTAAGLAFPREGEQLAAYDSEGRVVAATAGSGKTVHRARSPLGCIVWSVGGRALIAGSSEGAVFVADTETDATVPVFDTAAAVSFCGRSPGGDRFVFVTKDGMIYERELSLEPVWMQRKPEDPLDAKATSVISWKGLLEREHAPARR
jgi:WD40 repeat protein